MIENAFSGKIYLFHILAVHIRTGVSEYTEAGRYAPDI